MKRPILLLIILWAAVGPNWSQNPIVRTQQTTDPAPFVWDDTLYVLTGHDEDHSDFFWMQEWRLYRTTDMVNWTDLGSPLAIEDFAWADDRAWAPQMCERGGKFYLYVPLHSRLTNAMAIGVAVSDSPTGPYRDALGHPLVDGSWDYIDPTVLVDDDGRAYLYWGNPRLYYAELGDDMTSLRGEVRHFDDPCSGQDKYIEGPWIMRRQVPVAGKRASRSGRKTAAKPLYYMLYAAGGVPEHIAYSTSASPLGPWQYGGIVMPQCNSDAKTGQVGTDSFTNHCGIVDYRGHSYFFYHNGWLGGGFGRAVAVEEFEFGADGSIPTILPTREGITQPLASFNPNGRIEAETMADSRGLKSEGCTSAPVYVSEIHNGDWLKLRNVDFSLLDASARGLTVRAASGLRGGSLELHLDSIGGACLASVSIPGTGGWEQWQTFNSNLLMRPSGVHDLYLVFKGRKGPKLFNLDWWQL